MRRTNFSIEIVLALYAFSGPVLWAHLALEHHNETEHPPTPHEEHDHDAPLHDVVDHRSEPPAAPRDSLVVVLDLLLERPETLLTVHVTRIVSQDRVVLHEAPFIPSARSRSPPVA